MPSNGEIFSRFMYNAYGIGPEPEPEPTPGPRKPAPVPEAGQASKHPIQSDHADLKEFRETLKHWSGAYYKCN